MSEERSSQLNAWVDLHRERLNADPAYKNWLAEIFRDASDEVGVSTGARFVTVHRILGFDESERRTMRAEANLNTVEMITETEEATYLHFISGNQVAVVESPGEILGLAKGRVKPD